MISEQNASVHMWASIASQVSVQGLMIQAGGQCRFPIAFIPLIEQFFDALDEWLWVILLGLFGQAAFSGWRNGLRHVSFT